MSEQRYLVLGSEVRAPNGKMRYVSAMQLVRRHQLPMRLCFLVDSTDDLWKFNQRYYFNRHKWKVISPYPSTEG